MGAAHGSFGRAGTVGAMDEIERRERAAGEGDRPAFTGPPLHDRNLARALGAAPAIGRRAGVRRATPGVPEARRAVPLATESVSSGEVRSSIRKIERHRKRPFGIIARPGEDSSSCGIGGARSPSGARRYRRRSGQLVLRARSFGLHLHHR